MLGHDIVVVGASAGGVEALRELTALLPADLPAAVFLVVHIPANAPSVLPVILSRRGRLPAVAATDGEAIVPGRIYIAPPGRHLLVKRGHITVALGPRENGHRPAVDPLFRSAALAYGARVVGVVLSGNLDDGTAGLAAIKERGGAAIVQDPEESLYPGMPESALAHVEVDWTLPVAGIAAKLVELARTPPAGETGEDAVDDEMDVESGMAEMRPEMVHRVERPGTPSGFACPECGGALFEIKERDLERYRCRTGHAYSPETLLSHQGESLENSLWTALRALEESAALCGRMAERARQRGNTVSAGRHSERARSSRGHAEAIRRLLVSDRPVMTEQNVHPPDAAGGQVVHSEQRSGS